MTTNSSEDLEVQRRLQLIREQEMLETLAASLVRLESIADRLEALATSGESREE